MREVRNERGGQDGMNTERDREHLGMNLRGMAIFVITSDMFQLSISTSDIC